MGFLLRIIASASFILAVAVLVSFVLLSRSYRQASHDVCALVDQYYYRNQEPITRQFVELCYRTAKKQSFIFSKVANIQRINARLSFLKTSHLAVYDPDENRLMWENQGLDTGVRSRFIDDQIVVYRVLLKSSAERAGLRAGDSILTMNGQPISSPYDAQAGRGIFRVRRRNHEFNVRLNPEVVVEPLNPTLQDLGDGSAILRIPSFLSQYFELDAWLKIVAQLEQEGADGKPLIKNLMIDLRDNAGGSFPAMLRALSPFRCDDQFIGKIYRQSVAAPIEVDMRDNLESQSQLEQLSEARLFGCGPSLDTVVIGNQLWCLSIMAQLRSQRYLHKVFSPDQGRMFWGNQVAVRL